MQYHSLKASADNVLGDSDIWARRLKETSKTYVHIIILAELLSFGRIKRLDETIMFCCN